MFGPALENDFAREVRAGLLSTEQKTLPCRYFYDGVGSALFEAITQLPEYGLSRADTRLLQNHACEITAQLSTSLMVVELGSGSGAKTRPILEALGERGAAVKYYPIDTSSSSLARCARELAGLCLVEPLEASYVEGLRQAVSCRAPGQTLLVLFLGSTIGNFEPEAAIAFLCSIRTCLETGDALLLGTDLVKPVARLLAAYDDPPGVTAAFNLNLLARINRELAADFNLRRFEHVVRYLPEGNRIEMHIRSRARQTVEVPGAALSVDFALNETIRTETCHKFTTPQIREMARMSGFRVTSAWTDEQWPFSESLLLADSRSVLKIDGYLRHNRE